MKRLVAFLLTGVLTLSLYGCAQNAQSVSGTTSTSSSTALATDDMTEETGETEAAEAASEATAADPESAEASAETAAAAEGETAEAEAKPEAEAGETETEAAEAEAKPEAEAGETETETAETETETSSETENTEPAAEVAENTDAEAAETEAVTPGTVSETTYTQNHFGFQITLEEPWHFATADELAAQNQIIIDMAGDESVTEAVEKGNLFVDMVATNEMDFNTIMVRVVKLGLADFFQEEDDLYDVYSQSIHADAEATGMTDIEDVSGKVRFLGEDVRFVGVKGQLEVTEGFSTEMWYNCLLRQEGNFACLIFISGFSDFGGESFEELAARFEPV